MVERRLALALAVLLDVALGEPPNRWHPVAWLGSLAGRLEGRAPPSSAIGRLAYGALHAALLVGGSAAVGVGLERALVRQPIPLRVLVTAIVLKQSLSLRELARAAARTGVQLERGALGDARSSLRWLVSRPTDDLDVSQAASATIESLAENLSDSVLAPVAYFLLAGLPGALAYRAANTLDAMIGYHGEYEYLGKAAARLDDLLNLLPARLSGVLLVGAARLGFGDSGAAWSTMLGDHHRTESPNAGWPMSAAAGALRVRLEKVGHYCLGRRYRPPTPGDVRRAVRLYYAAAGLGLLGGLLVPDSGSTGQQVRPADRRGRVPAPIRSV